MSTSSVITTTAAASRSAGMTWSLVSLLFTLLAGGCTTIPVSVDFDPSVSFSEFQSVRQALTHDATYGALARATTATNKWWQGASIAENWT
ncbi:MAG: hypothetical protein JRE70_15845, partial [Deltaproteobacteria bacterium]|nr:hypothetical protein [Deltaproteobacteria bacterium]